MHGAVGAVRGAAGGAVVGELSKTLQGISPG